MWFLVIDFSWKVFSETGSIETYLLIKELEGIQTDDEQSNKFIKIDSPI